MIGSCIPEITRQHTRAADHRLPAYDLRFIAIRSCVVMMPFVGIFPASVA
jgi:hypothetical protein